MTLNTNLFEHEKNFNNINFRTLCIVGIILPAKRYGFIQ